MYDARERTWRHLDIWQHKAYIHCKLPRLDCGGGGPVTAEVPWAAPDAKRFTALLGARVLVMAMPSMPAKGIAGVVREHDARVWAMLGRTVAKAHAEADFSGAAAAGVDGTARRRGHNHLTSFVDLDGERVMACALGRGAGAVAGFARGLAGHGGDPEKVAVATCGPSPAFAKGVEESPPNAERAADRFHVIQLATRQLDKARAAEAKEPKEKRALLSRSKCTWLKNEANPTGGQAERKRSLAEEHPKAARACAMKEALQAVCECGSRAEAESELDALCSWVMHSNIPQMKAVAKTVRENKAEILNYFDHRRTNAVLEGMNSIIQSAKRQARGFSGLERFKTIIYLNLGKLHFPQLAARATH